MDGKVKNFIRLLGLLAAANFSSFLVQDDGFTFMILVPSIGLLAWGLWEGMLD